MEITKNCQIFFRYLLIIGFVIDMCSSETSVSADNDNQDSFKIEGRVEVVSSDKDWIANTLVMVEGGEYIAHLR